MSTEEVLALSYLPAAESLLGIERREGAEENYYAEYVQALADIERQAVQVAKRLRQKYESLKDIIAEKEIGNSQAEEVQRHTERRQTIAYIVDDAESLMSMVGTIFTTYREMAEIIGAMSPTVFAPAYISHREETMAREGKALNALLRSLNLFLQDTDALLTKEINMTKSGIEIDLEGQHFVLQLSQTILQGRSGINDLLTARMTFLEGSIRSLREDMAKVQMHQIEREVSARRLEMQQRRYQHVVEDVKDYDDLEGQYRHKYDEEGNYIETESAGEGGHRRDWLAIGIGIVLVAAVLLYLQFAK